MFRRPFDDVLMLAHSRRTTLSLLLAAIALLSLGPSACKRNRLASKAPPPPKTIVHVTNSDFLDATVYVVRQGQNLRLGTASSNATTTFVIPAQVVFGSTSLSFLIDPVGSNRRQTTAEVVVNAGDELELRVGGGRPQIAKRSE